MTESEGNYGNLCSEQQLAIIIPIMSSHTNLAQTKLHVNVQQIAFGKVYLLVCLCMTIDHSIICHYCLEKPQMHTEYVYSII